MSSVRLKPESAACPSTKGDAGPVPHVRILESFLNDCIRLSGEAIGWVEALERDRAQGAVRVVNVRGFYECIHTIKGTALMVPEARHVAESLHELEGILACRSLVDSAADPTWIPRARQAIERTRIELLELQSLERFAASQRTEDAPSAERKVIPLEIRVSLELDGEQVSVFYPQDWVVEILEPRRWQGRFSWQSGGSAIPIRGAKPGEWPALVLEDSEGFRWVQVFGGAWTLGAAQGSGAGGVKRGPSWREGLSDRNENGGGTKAA